MLQIMLYRYGGLVATPQFRNLFVACPLYFSMRYPYIRPISRNFVVCLCVCRSQGDAAPRDDSPRFLDSYEYSYSTVLVADYALRWVGGDSQIS